MKTTRTNELSKEELEAKAMQNFQEVYDEERNFPDEYSERTAYEAIGGLAVAGIGLSGIIGAGMLGYAHGSGNQIDGVSADTLLIIPGMLGGLGLYNSIKDEARVKNKFQRYQISSNEKPFYDKIDKLNSNKNATKRVSKRTLSGAVAGALIEAVPYAIGYIAGAMSN